LTALVARGLKPGTKMDNVLVFEGLPGLGKSTIFEIIGGEFFCESSIEIGNKDSQLLAGRYWICELSELVSIRKTGQHALKAFYSRRVDSFRRPYGSGYEDCPRRVLFVGTTNEAGYLTDETGNRKYWCVAVVFIDEAIARLRVDRNQLIAEAVHNYFAAYQCHDCRPHLDERCPMHRWWFSYKEMHITEEEADKRMVENPARLAVEAWWYGMLPAERPEGFTTLDVANAAMDLPAGQVRDGGMLQAIGHALSKMGFHSRRDTTGLRTRRYFPTDALKIAPRMLNPITRTGTGSSLFALPSLPMVHGGHGGK
jgi:DNA polymerase III delta prime subunit